MRGHRKRKAVKGMSPWVWIGLAFGALAVVGIAVAGVLLATRGTEKPVVKKTSEPDSAGPAAPRSSAPAHLWTRGSVPGTKLSAEFPQSPKPIGPWSNGNSGVTVTNAAVACETAGPAGKWTFEVLCVTTTHADPAVQKGAEADNPHGGILRLPVGATSPVGGKVVRKLEIQGRPAAVLATDIPEGRQVRMVFSDGGRAYTLTFIGKEADESHPVVRRFLESVHFD